MNLLRLTPDSLLLAATLVLVAPLCVADSAAAEPNGTVPIHEIRSMLEAELSEEVILAWIDQSGRALELPEPAELIELKEAGASEAFLSHLLERAGTGSSEAEISAAPPATPPTSAPRSSAIEPPAPADKNATVDPLVEIALRFSPRGDDEDDDWDFLVYLDGEPLSWVPQTDALEGSPGIELQRRLTPGRHRIRVSFERHSKRRGRWLHAAWFAPTELRFEIVPGADAQLEVTLREKLLDLGSDDGLRLRFRQQDDVNQITGSSDRERWNELCEEIAASPPARTERARTRREARCVGWSELWEGQSVPPRQDVRQLLERFDFRPVPAGS